MTTGVLAQCRRTRRCHIPRACRFITGPEVIKTVTHEEVTKEQLGGAQTHASRSGVAHFIEADELACIARLRELLSFMPGNNSEDPPRRATQDPPDRVEAALDGAAPDESNKPYDIKKIIGATVDDARFIEVHKDYAKNIATCLAHEAVERARRVPSLRPCN